MKKCFIIILISIGFSARSQNFFTTAFGGLSNYQGDIQDNAFTLLRSKPAWGLGLMFELNNRMLIRADFTAGKIYGDDRYSKKNRARNLSFRSDIAEFSIGFEYVLFNLYEYKVSPYAFAGVGIFKFSPYVNAPNGSKIILSELDTEGQGFFAGRTKYKLRQVCIPFGGGLQWAITDNKRLALVVGIRKTFTDYLDDVSTTYVDRNLLAQKKGQQSVSFAYRGDELANGDPYPVEGTRRGNPANDDWYYVAGISMRVRIVPKGRKRDDAFKPRRASVACPKPF